MWKLFWVTVCLSHIAAGYRVLLVFPFPGQSHGILGDGFKKHLLDAGHEVTYITPFPVKDPPKNLRQIDISSNFQHFPENLLNIKALLNKEHDMTSLKTILDPFILLSIATISNENVKKLMNNPNENFDVIVVEWMLFEIYAGFSQVFNCPYIWFSSMEPHWMVLSLIDDMPNPAYNTDIMTTNSLPLSMLGRWNELFIQVKGSTLKKLYYDKEENEAYQKYFGPAVAKRGRTLAPLDIVKYNASLMLGNSHVSLGEATRLPQNYKPIGGYHIDTDLKPLPEDLQKIMDNAKNGVIYFSMGSNLKSKDLPEVLKKGLLELFGSIKQTVLWKFEEVLQGLPKNVHILKWAPQASILAHPNCVLFITHGGLLSTTETIHYGVPIVGIPVFGDQFVNVQRVVNKGYGLRVDLSYSLPQDLKGAIHEMTSNPKYMNKIQELSLIYHDRPATPGKELVHWVAHVVRTGGAAHLRSPAMLVSWYQKWYLDLAGTLLVAVLVLGALLKRISRLLFGKKVSSKKLN